MLDKNEATGRVQHASHFSQYRGNFMDGAKRPCNDDGVDAGIRKRQGQFRGLCEKLDGMIATGYSFVRHALEFERWVHAIDPPYFLRVVGEIEPGSDTDFQHISSGVRNPG
jgi:hypothetical protein